MRPVHRRAVSHRSLAWPGSCHSAGFFDFQRPHVCAPKCTGYPVRCLGAFLGEVGLDVFSFDAFRSPPFRPCAAGWSGSPWAAHELRREFVEMRKGTEVPVKPSKLPEAWESCAALYIMDSFLHALDGFVTHKSQAKWHPKTYNRYVCAACASAEAIFGLIRRLQPRARNSMPAVPRYVLHW